MELQEIGLVFDTFYDLIFHVSVNFVEFTNDSEQRILSMFNKKLEVVYNTFFDITSALTRATYHFEKMQNKSRINATTAYEVLTKFITTGLIFKLNTGKNVASQVSYSGDHNYFKLACSVTDQETIPTGSASKKAKKSVGPDQHLHPSMVVCGSVLFLQKKNPTPISHLNPFVKIDMDTGTIVADKKFVPVLDKLYKSLTVEEFVSVDKEFELLDEHDIDSGPDSD
jgi:Fe2+ or Zn2+ uptake regulation protein